MFIRIMVLILLTIFLPVHGVFAAPAPGETAPAFSLTDMAGKPYSLAKMTDTPMVILYFFDPGSRSSVDGLMVLDDLAKKYKEANLSVWGITLSQKTEAAAFIEKQKPLFPVLVDGASRVSDLYDAKMILPTVCIVGPQNTIIDYFQGGGKSTEKMLVRLAERKLSQKETGMAIAISQSVEKINPENQEVKAVKGYAALEEGRAQEAEALFTTLSKEKGKEGAAGLEGLAAVQAKAGNSDTAMKLLDEVEKKAPDRAYASVIKGNILYSQNKKEAAKKAFEQATRKKEGAIYQKASAFNQLGRVYANEKEYGRARSFYDQAIELDPYYIEATANKGVTYEKEGDWSRALQLYKNAQVLQPADGFTRVLAKKAEEIVALSNDTEKRKRVDALVKDLAERYKKEKKKRSKKVDEWTSRPLIISFADLEEKGGLSEADGYQSVLLTQLSEMLNGSGRVSVVERMVLERLLDELNLGSSALSDPETSLTLGKIMAAKLIGTGSLLHLPHSVLLNLRFVDTETTALAKVISEELGQKNTLEKDLNRLSREILKSVIDLYPVRGFVVQAEEGSIMINVGKKQGVVLGTLFSVVEEKAPVTYKGRVLKALPSEVAEIKVTSVEPDFSYAAIIKKKRALKNDDAIIEKQPVK